MPKPRAYINPPVFTPSQYGLLSVAQDLTATAPPHWETGVWWEPLCSTSALTFADCFLPPVTGTPEPEEKSATMEHSIRGATPFTVYNRKDCSAPGYWDDARNEVVQGLTESEGFQVELAFFDGIVGGAKVNMPHLAADVEVMDGDVLLQPAVGTLSDTVVDVTEGLAFLETFLGICYQGQGVIHVPVAVAPHLAAENLITLRNGRYVTTAGNLVAIGNGYSGNSPAGLPVDNAEWIYATGAVFYIRSDIRTIAGADAFNRENNTLEALAERTYVVGWDCCLYGIPVAVSGLPAGAPDSPAPRIAV